MTTSAPTPAVPSTTDLACGAPVAHRHTSTCWWDEREARWVCRAVTAAIAGDLPVEAPCVDVRDMIVVHTALLREFRLAPAAVQRVAAGDTRQARRVGEHLRFVSDLLHHHHEGEDELLWPKLVDRAPAQARVLADGQDQHLALDAALTDVARLRDSWTAQATSSVRDELALRLEHLSSLLGEHLDLEERCLLPVAAAVLTQDEWDEIGARAAAAMPKPALALALGMFAYEGDPAVVAAMLGQAPPPARVVLRRLAPRLYARRARRVHGTARP